MKKQREGDDDYHRGYRKTGFFFLRCEFQGIEKGKGKKSYFPFQGIIEGNLLATLS